ncbi:MAG TPA: RHS repeat-associated core domain-containing protein [Solirubrobacteraceae bacterium]
MRLWLVVLCWWGVGAWLLPSPSLGEVWGPEPLVPLAAPPPTMSETDESLPPLAAKARREREEREAWLRTPKAVEARRESRTAYRGLSAPESLATARRWFPELAKPVWEPPKLEPGDVVTGYEGDYAMRVDKAGPGGGMLVDSSLPLWATTSSGDRKRLTVALQDRGASLVPENPLAKTSIAKDPRRGIDFMERGFTLVPGGTSAASPQVIGGKAYFANAYADTDWIVAPLPDGVETYWQVRSPMGPESFTLAINGPAGAHLQMSADEPNAVELVDGDERLALIAPPTASDAQGQAVEVSYEIQGLSLVVHVAHRAGDFAYPILVDPQIRDSDSQPRPNGWFCSASGAYWCGYGGGPFGWGQYMTRNGSVFSSVNTIAQWSYIPPGQSYIASYGFSNLNFDLGTYICWIAGTKYPNDSAWESGLNSAGQGGPMQICNSSIRNGGGWFAGTREGGDRNIATTRIFNYVATTCCGAMMDVGYQEVWLADDNKPTISSFSVSPAPTGGWMTVSSVSGTATSNDAGLGVNYLYAAGATGPGSNQITSEQYIPRGCAGTAGSPCQGPFQASFTIPLPEGDQSTAMVKGIDAGGTWGDPSSYVYKIDRTAPAIDLTGRLGAAQNRAISSRMRLEVAGDDTIAGRGTSGTQSVSLSVAASQVRSKTGSAQRLQLDPYDFDPSSRPMGPVAFRVDTSDVAGNTGTRTFDVTVARGQITTLMEGQRTAKRMVLQARDLRPADAPTATQVRFQYRRELTDAWQDVPASALRTTDNQTVSDNNLTMSLTPEGKLSPKVVWDVASTIGGATDKPVYVRGYFGSEAGNVTEDVYTRVDPSGVDTDDAQANIGPGQSDLLTGNFSLSATDVSIDSFKSDLTVRRTYNSRKLADGPLGKGWTLGTSVLAAGSTFLYVTDYAEKTPEPDDDSYGIASLTAQDGGELIFEEHETDHGYYSEPGLEELQLERLVNADGTTQSFRLTDKGSSDVLVFDRRSEAGIYQLTSVTQPASASTTTFRYEPVPGSNTGLRVTRMLAPVAANIDCSGDLAATTTGCRSLRFEWGDGATAPTNRLYRIWFTAPGAGLTSSGAPVTEVAVSQYAYDSSGRLVEAWDPRISPTLKTMYRYSGTTDLLAGIKPPGENEWQPEYQPLTGDGTDGGRLKRVKRTTPQGAPPTTDGDATETVQFGVPVSGSGAPYDMSPTQLAAWSQDDDLPTDAAAIFRPDDVPSADPPTSYAKASVHYLDGFGREVNAADPGGEIDTSEHDAAGNVVRELTAANRARALQSGTTTAEHAAKADQLDTDRTYTEAITGTGWRLIDEYGPLHAVRLADGSSVSARQHTHIDYDENKADPNVIYNLPTTAKVSARVAGTDRDTRTTTVAYDWTLRKPTATTVDPGGLSLKTTTVYDSQGLVVKQRLPRSPDTDAASTRETVYYKAGDYPTETTCGNKPQWVNLPCKIRSAAQPTSGSQLPVTVQQYDAYQNVTQSQDTVDNILRRTTTKTYDAAGRLATEQVVGNATGAGTDPARKTYDYSASSGRLTTTTTPATTPVRTITRSYDAVGRISTYTDADGAVTTTRYDLLGRPARVSDTGGGDRTMTYDATTGRLAQINDTTVGVINASAYDADGVLTRQSFQTAGLDLVLGYDETGDLVQRTYRKTSNCSSSCDWLAWTAAPSIHGQWLSQTGSDGARTYAYDAMGRLTQAQDQPTSAGCTTRAYQYDADSNRTQLKTYPAGSGGACSTTTTPTTGAPTYDEADRITGTGYDYDVLGRIRTVPAGAAGGSALSAEYYVDDVVQSLTQAGATTTIDRDPEDRVRGRTVLPQSSVVSHYADEGDEPVWTQQGTSSTRNFSDITGDLAAVQTPGTGLTLELSDLHGDVVAEIPNSATASPPTPFAGTDEFGSPRPGAAGQPIQKIATSVKALTTAATSVPITKPTGTAPGDLLVAQVTAVNNANISAPTGWTSIDGGEMISFNTRYSTYYKIASANEPSSYSFTFDQSKKHIGAITALRNTAQQSPIDAVGSDYGNDVDHVVPSVTPGVANTAQLVFTGRNTGDSNGGSIFSFPSPLIEEWEATSGTASNDRSAGGALRVMTGGAGTPTGPFTVTNETGYGAAFWAAITATIKPQNTGATRNQAIYGYLGAKQRNTTLASGAIEMGARVYLPQLGRFLQTDPIPGGSCNDYDYACQDPVNSFDLDGRMCTDGNCKDYWPKGCMPGQCPGDGGSIGFWDVVQIASLFVGPEFSVGGLAGEAAARVAVKAVAGVLAKRQGQRLTMTVAGRGFRIALHDHAGGPHAYKHLQINTWRVGEPKSGKTRWRSRKGWLP